MLDWVVTRVLRKNGDIGKRRGIAEEERVTVRLRSSDSLGANCAAGTPAVLDHYALPEGRLHVLANDAREHVTGPAWPGRYDDPDRLGRIRVGLNGSRRKHDGRDCGE